jgi:DNA-binding transcriptional LysR family regulator
VPNTFSLSAGQRQHLEPAVSAWVAWSAEHRGLDEAAAARLTESLPEVFGRFGAAYDDPEAAAARSYLADVAVGDADVARLSEHVARRMFAVPMPLLASADPPDASDPQVRRALIQDEFAECTPHAGLSHEEFIAAVQRVVGELWDGDPEETFAEARRLFASGADRHDIIHTLAETPAAAGGKTSPAAAGGQTNTAATGSSTDR